VLQAVQAESGLQPLTPYYSDRAAGCFYKKKKSTQQPCQKQ
jgi:hypothetical protein